MSIIDYLNTPFPRPKRNRRNLLWVVLVGIASSLFILLYQPFGIENTSGEWFVNLIILSLGLLFILSVLFMEWLIPSIFPNLFRNWTFGKALVWYALVILFIGAIQFLYKSFWSNFQEFTWGDFLGVLARTLGIGITVSFFVTGIWQYFNRRRLSLISSAETYTVTSQSGREISLNLKDILYISSDDNYVDIHYNSAGERKKLVFRSSLKNVEKQIVNRLSPIIRCHRSYLINSEHFEIENPSNRNMTVKLKSHSDSVPVSGQYTTAVRSRLQIHP